MAWWHGLIDWSPTIVPFQVTTCLGVTVSFLRSLPALPSVTLIPTSWTRRHSLSFPRAGRYSGFPRRRPYCFSLRSIPYEGSPYMSSPIHSSLLPSFVPFSSIVTSWSSQTPSKSSWTVYLISSAEKHPGNFWWLISRKHLGLGTPQKNSWEAFGLCKEMPMALWLISRLRPADFSFSLCHSSSSSHSVV